MKFQPFIILLFIFSLSQGQFKEPKFGKIEISELQMQRYEKDTVAAALFLFDNGFSNFTINMDRHFQYAYTRHFRIKIFKKSAIHLGDVNIKLYENNSLEEAITNIDAVTYNLVDGKIIKTKVDNRDIFREQSKNFNYTKFAFPEVKEGSVIELSYTITSDFLYNFRGWDFQHAYPALWSQYRYEIPEYFIYHPNSKGYLNFDINTNESGTANYTLHYESEVSPGMGGERTPSYNTNITAKTDIKTLAIKDVPAFISEPNIDCEENYIQSIEFELSSIQYPGDIRKDYTRSWESVNREMNNDEDFGALLRNDGFIRDTVQRLCLEKETEIEKAISIYNYVLNRMEWNNTYRIYALDGLKKPYLNRVGNSAEINLLLTLMLQTAGLKAYPVMFGTRNNGITNTFYPTISKYNSVLTQVIIDGKAVLLDATDRFCPFGILPPNDLNGKGRIVNEVAGDWAELISQEKHREIKSYTLDIDSDGIFKGIILGRYEGYAGIAFRNALSVEKSNDDFILKLQEKQDGLKIINYSFLNKLDIYKFFSDSLIVEITDKAENIGDRILFYPLLFERIEKNNYSLEDRKYPVNYNYPISELYIFDYTIPAGYEVESIPQSVVLKLPDNSISMSYSIQQTENKIKVVYKRNINKVLFLPEEYQNLKQFYDLMVKKHTEQIILKKIIS